MDTNYQCGYSTPIHQCCLQLHLSSTNLVTNYRFTYSIKIWLPITDLVINCHFMIIYQVQIYNLKELRILGDLNNYCQSNCWMTCHFKTFTNLEELCTLRHFKSLFIKSLCKYFIYIAEQILACIPSTFESVCKKSTNCNTYSTLLQNIF